MNFIETHNSVRSMIHNICNKNISELMKLKLIRMGLKLEDKLN